MPQNKPIAIYSKISRSGFSAERIFEVQLEDGSYQGAVHYRYCFACNDRPIGEDEPPRGETMEGKVAARRITEEEGDKVLVSVPDGAVLEVNKNQIAKLPKELRFDVPVQP